MQKYITIPNVLSAYRVVSAPFVLLLIAYNMKVAFTVCLIINFITDILDGYLARKYKLQTPLGALLDSWADVATYIIAFSGIIKFEWAFVESHVAGLSCFVILYLLSMLVTMLKFGRICGLHLYSFKLTGYLQGIFMVLLFVFGNIEWLYYLMITVGCLANIEEMIIFHLLEEPQSNVKGLYWIVKKNKP